MLIAPRSSLSADGRGGMDLEMFQIDPNIEHWNFVSPGNSDQGGPRKHVHTLPTIITSHKRISSQSTFTSKNGERKNSSHVYFLCYLNSKFINSRSKVNT